MFWKWLQWHKLNFWLKFLLVLGLVKNKAINDVNAAINSKISIIEAGGGANFENEVAASYYVLWGTNFDASRLNAYFIILNAAIIIFLYRIMFPLGGLTDMYLFWSALGVAVIIIMLFIYEMFFFPNEQIDVKQDEYEKAKKWLKYIGDESRGNVPIWAKIFVGLGLLIEGFAICVIAMTYIGDFNQIFTQILGLLLGVVVTVVIGVLVHKAGVDIYREQHRQVLYNIIAREGGMTKRSDTSSEFRFESETYSELSDLDHSFDIEEKGFWRKNWSVIAAIFAVLLISTLAFLARAEFNKELIAFQKDVGVQQNYGDYMNHPEETSQQLNQNEADIRAAEAGVDIKAMYLALALLTSIFIVVNYFGAYIGYEYSFYHKRSVMELLKIRSFEMNQSDKGKNVDFMTAARQKVEKKANQFFAKYHQVLIDKARQINVLQKALNDRGAFKFQTYIKEQK